MKPEEIADQCIMAGFNDYAPDTYSTARIKAAIIRAIETERAVQMAARSRDASRKEVLQGDSSGTRNVEVERGECAQESSGREMAVNAAPTWRAFVNYNGQTISGCHIVSIATYRRGATS